MAKLAASSAQRSGKTRTGASRKAGSKPAPRPSRSASTEFRLLGAGVGAILIGALALYAHIEVYRAGDDYTGALVFLDRLFDLGLVSSLAAVAFCSGRAICKRLCVGFENIAEETSFSVMSGFGTIALGVVALGLTGLLKPLPVTLLIVTLCAFGHKELPRLVQVLASAWKSATATKGRCLATVLFGALLVILTLRAATPPHAYDEAIYHLAVAKQFASRGRIYPVTDNWAGNMPFLIESIYTICLLVKSDLAAKLVSLGLALNCCVAIYGFCARFINRRTGLIAIFAFFGAGMVVEVAVTSRIDVSLAGALFLATYAMMIYLETGERAWLLVSGITSGLAMGMKYSAGIWLALLGVMFLIESVTRSRGFYRTIKHAALYVFVAAAIGSPWFLKNLVWFHNPVYPFVTGEVAQLGPSGPRYFNAGDEVNIEAQFEQARVQIPGVVDQRMRTLQSEAAQHVTRHPWHFWEYFLRPDDYNMAEDNHYPNYLFLLVPLLLFYRGSRWLWWLAGLSIAFFLTATSASWVARVLLPVYPPLTIVASYALARMVGLGELAPSEPDSAASAAPAWRKWRTAAIFLFIATGSIAIISIRQFSDDHGPDFIVGGISRRDFMSRMFYYPSIDFINRDLPPDARVLMVGAQMSYDVRRDCIPDVSWDSVVWRRLLARNTSLTDLSEDIKRQGITHVLFTDSLYKWAARQGRENYPSVSRSRAAPDRPDYYDQLVNWSTFSLYARDHLERIYGDKDGYLIFKVK